MSDENIFLFYAIYLGVYITFIYDMIRVCRRVFAHREWLVSMEDIGFWIYCTGKVFVVMYRLSDGMLRWFAVLGALAGMCLYKKFISGFFVKYTVMVLSRIKIKAHRVIIFLARPTVKRYRIIKKKLTIALKMLKMTVSGLHNSDNKITKNHNPQKQKYKVQQKDNKKNDERHGRSMARSRVAYRKRRQNRFSIFLTAFVVLLIMIAVTWRGIELQQKISDVDTKIEQLNTEIAEEEARSEEIKEYGIYTQTKAFIEEVAKDKLGLVYEGEIMFKQE